MSNPLKVKVVVDNRPIINKLIKGIKNGNNFTASDMEDPKMKKHIAEQICNIARKEK